MIFDLISDCTYLLAYIDVCMGRNLSAVVIHVLSISVHFNMYI